MDAVVMRINSFNIEIESFSKKGSSSNLGSEKSLEGSVDSNTKNDDLNSKKEKEQGPVGGADLLNITTAITTLESVDGSLLNMQLFASRFITIVAVSQGEFSVSCDMSRYYLKLLEAQVEPHNDDFMMWTLRGLSLAGLGRHSNTAHLSFSLFFFISFSLFICFSVSPFLYFPSSLSVSFSLFYVLILSL
jgi:hypothetical protein